MWNVARRAGILGLVMTVAYACGATVQRTSGPEVPAAVPAEAPAAVVVPSPGGSLADATVIELSTLRSDPARYEWFQFKPGVKKLILSGTPESRHVSVLWYGYEGKPGAVPLHYHAQTESIFVIDGAQTDAKGVYGRGSFYFNPPGSGHDISDSAGLFLLSYAAPPDFKRTAEIAAYENLTVDADYSRLVLEPCADGSLCYALPLATEGGMHGRFVKPRANDVVLSANVLLVLQGSCTVAGQALASDTLVVTKNTAPATYQISSPSSDCLLFASAFK